MVKWDDFLEIVDRNFKYLETEFGFRKVSTQIPSVEYESSFLRISIYYDIANRKELDVGIWPLQTIRRKGERFGIGSLVKLHNPDPDESEDYMSPFPLTKEQLEIEVQKYAALLLKYGSDVLHGDLLDLFIWVKVAIEASEIMRTPQPGKSIVQVFKEVARKYAIEHLKEHAREHQHKDDSKS